MDIRTKIFIEEIFCRVRSVLVERLQNDGVAETQIEEFDKHLASGLVHSLQYVNNDPVGADELLLEAVSYLNVYYRTAPFLERDGKKLQEHAFSNTHIASVIANALSKVLLDHSPKE